MEVIEEQQGAYPYHDWNERIAAECYGPNAASRILDAEGKIVEIVSNYSKISFNFGPTLFSWLESEQPDIYAAVIEADKESRRQFSGHGSAIAQAYNHTIMPLSNARDKRTQVVWGIRDFQRRFGRDPEGMWLPETAVDIESLEELAAHGIAFTILAPHQARRIRLLGGGDWEDVSGQRVDTTRPYRVSLPSGKHIAIFFYDSPVSHGVAFDKLLGSGEQFMNRLMGIFDDRRGRPQLAHIANDGETYGHHHRFGDMALAYALNRMQKENLAHITNYGEFLEKFPPSHEVEIVEQTSWSCSHGIERWRSDCGCDTGFQPSWNQQWRGPLREALDWLRDTANDEFLRLATRQFKDPWAARNDYIDVILDRAPRNVQRFLSRHMAAPPSETEKITALKLMELQHNMQLMYSSCGWFFDDLAGIEGIQILHFAGRAAQLAQELFGDHAEKGFLERLAKAVSNDSEQGDGAQVFEKHVRSSMVDLEKVAAHWAVSSLFESYDDKTKLFVYEVERQDYRVRQAGRTKLAVGRMRIRSEQVGEAATFMFGVLHMGDHNVVAGVRDYRSEGRYQAAMKELEEAYEKVEMRDLVRTMDKHFGLSAYSLRSLFHDERRKVLEMILKSARDNAEASFRQLYERDAPLMRFLLELGIAPPKAFQATAEFLINIDLRNTLAQDEPDVARLEWLMTDAKRYKVALDQLALVFAFRNTLERLMKRLMLKHSDVALIAKIIALVAMARRMPSQVDLWKVQNDFHTILTNVYQTYRTRESQGEAPAQEWVRQFTALGDQLGVRVR